MNAAKTNQTIRSIIDYGGLAVFLAVYFLTGKDMIKANWSLAAASGVAFRIEGEPEVPDWRPSPMQGRDRMPRLISAAGGCMFTTSAPPG